MKRNKNKHAVALGSIGGSSKSPAKVSAARENAKKAGRPMKEYKELRERYDRLRSLALDAVNLNSGDMADKALDALAEELQK